MNPLLKQFLEEVLRSGLKFVFAGLVAAGYIQNDNVSLYITGAVGFILTVGWGLWETYKKRWGFEIALKLPRGSTPADVKAAKTKKTRAARTARPALSLTGTGDGRLQKAR